MPSALILVCAGIYLAIRFGVTYLLKQFAVHRGMFQRPAAAIAGLTAFLIFASEEPIRRYFVASAVVLGFLTHLILDEIWSVKLGMFGPKIKKSFGTAVKFLGNEAWANIVTYLLVIILGALAASDAAVNKHVGSPPADGAGRPQCPPCPTTPQSTTLSSSKYVVAFSIQNTRASSCTLVVKDHASDVHLTARFGFQKELRPMVSPLGAAGTAFLGIQPLLVGYLFLITIAAFAGGISISFLTLGHRRLQVLLSFTGGVLLGVGMLHLIPHAFLELNDRIDTTMSWVLLGFFVMFLLERAFHAHSHHTADGCESTHTCVHDAAEYDRLHGHAPDPAHHAHKPSQWGWSGAFIGLGLHSLTDGCTRCGCIFGYWARCHLARPCDILAIFFTNLSMPA